MHRALLTAVPFVYRRKQGSNISDGSVASDVSDVAASGLLHLVVVEFWSCIAHHQQVD